MLLRLWTLPGHHSPGCTFLAVPYTSGSSLGITALGTVPAVYSLSLCWRAHICYGTPDSILTLFLSSFIHTVGLLQKTLALETSSAPKLIPPQDVLGLDGTTGALLFRFLDQALTPAPISPALSYSGHLDDTETMTVFI